MKKASFTIGLRSLIGEKSASSKILSNVAVSLAIWLSRIGDPPSTWMVLRQSGTPRETTQVNIKYIRKFHGLALWALLPSSESCMYLSAGWVHCFVWWACRWILYVSASESSSGRLGISLGTQSLEEQNCLQTAFLDCYVNLRLPK